MATTTIKTRQIEDKAITLLKIQDLSAQTLIGRYSNSTGVGQQITLGNGIILDTSTGILNTVNFGTVTNVSVVSANGFGGTVATSTSTPAITLTTSITGVLKGSGGALVAAIANTDYLIPSYTGFDSRYLQLTGGTISGFLTLNADPTNSFHAVTKNYVDNLVTGLSWKNAVKAATTATGTLATSFANGSTIDGVVLVTNDRILIKNQATASENGIYVVQTSGAPVRALDSDTASELDSATVMVEYGTINANTQWTETATITTINTSTVTFVQISGSGTYTNGTGILLTGTAFSLDTAYTNTLYTTLGRNITINGITQNLSVDRTFTITTTGTTNRITVTSGATATPTIDIAATYVGQASITTLGTITSGIWNGTAINLSTYASGTLQAAQFPALTGEATTTAGSLSVTLTNSAVIGKVITGFVSGSGTVIASDTILSAINKLDANIGLRVISSRFIVRETPTGALNNSNQTFTLANTPTTGKESVFLNGILQLPGSGNDYTISTNTITMAVPPDAFSVILVSYIF